MRYTVLIDGEQGGYGVVFPDLPGCTAMGATVDDALFEAASAARAWMRVVEGRGGEVPAPRDLEALRACPDVLAELAAGAVLGSVVVVRQGGPPIKVNLSLDEQVLATIDAAAERNRMTRSAMVERLAEVGLPHVN